MKYLLATLALLAVAVSYGQGSRNGETSYGKALFDRPDTAVWPRVAPSKSWYGSNLNAFEYPIQGKTTFAYYQLPGVRGEVAVQNSLPKGGIYTDAAGRNFSHVVFWYRVINQTDAPLELTMSFDAFAALPDNDSFLKLLLPPDTMSLDKTMLYDYGVTSLESFVTTEFNTPTMLQRTLSPSGESLFYIVVLSNAASLGDGPVRAELVVKGKNVFYKISGTNLPPDTLIPCGQIAVRQ